MEKSARKTWMGVIAVVVLALAGYRTFFASGAKVDLPDTYRCYGVCLHCGEEAVGDYKTGDPPPYVCQACGERTVLPWWFCYDCGYRFIPQLVASDDGLPHPTPYPFCTHCGCRSVTAWDADDPGLAPEGDAKLPKWPE